MSTIPIWTPVTPDTSEEAQSLLYTIVTEGENFISKIGQDDNGDLNVWFGFDLTEGTKKGSFSVNNEIENDIASITSANFPDTNFTGTSINYTPQDAAADQTTLGLIVSILNEYPVGGVPTSMQAKINTYIADLHLLKDVTLTPLASGSAFDLVQLVIDQSLAAAPILQTIPALSYEQIALDDLAYNGGAGIVAGTGRSPSHTDGDINVANAAASSGDWLNAWSERASVWYEIVIGDNGGTVDRKGIQNRRFREGGEFGLYSQGTRWDGESSNDPSEGIYQIPSNMPNSSDMGEEAVTTLRFLQGNSAEMVTYFGSSSFKLSASPSQIVADYESPAVTVIDQILGSFASTLSGAAVTFSDSVSTVLDQQAVKDQITDTSSSGGYLLIGGDYQEVVDTSVTQGFTYNSSQPLPVTITGDSHGQDTFVAFTGTNVVDATGNNNVIFGDLVSLSSNSTTININASPKNNTFGGTINHETIYAGSEAEDINLDVNTGKNLYIYLDSGTDYIELPYICTDTTIVLGASSGVLICSGGLLSNANNGNVIEQKLGGPNLLTDENDVDFTWGTQQSNGSFSKKIPLNTQQTMHASDRSTSPWMVNSITGRSSQVMAFIKPNILQENQMPAVRSAFSGDPLSMTSPVMSPREALFLSPFVDKNTSESAHLSGYLDLNPDKALSPEDHVWSKTFMTL